MGNVLEVMISKSTYVGWMTNGHMGQEILLRINTPVSDRLIGIVDIADIPTEVVDLN